MEKIVHNVETGEITLEPLSEIEIAEKLKLRAEQEAEQAKLAAEAEAKEAARQVLLDKLGITADEAKLLLG